MAAADSKYTSTVNALRRCLSVGGTLSQAEMIDALSVVKDAVNRLSGAKTTLNPYLTAGNCAAAAGATCAGDVAIVTALLGSTAYQANAVADGGAP